MNNVWIGRTSPVGTVYVVTDGGWVLCRVGREAMDKAKPGDWIFSAGYLYPVTRIVREKIDAIEVKNDPKTESEVTLGTK